MHCCVVSDDSTVDVYGSEVDESTIHQLLREQQRRNADALPRVDRTEDDTRKCLILAGVETPFEGLYEEGRRVSDEAVVYGVWPYISRSVVGLTPDSSLVTSHHQLRDNNRSAFGHCDSCLNQDPVPSVLGLCFVKLLLACCFQQANNSLMLLLWQQATLF
ncbi:hypothetical protein PROFUN_05526 [Planoprotostelium fungivorum]|uniref:Uncharacterized protein n=1 Tax=Planoprotostelium fungivorum TaxID=1890364 RepID=A0A2P6NR03_9EUKA|nr:hypothetical protein PROFUN_05526 [Planoprotostelium fungivorum]